MQLKSEVHLRSKSVQATKTPRSRFALPLKLYLKPRWTGELMAMAIDQAQLMRTQSAVSVNFNPSMCVQLEGNGHNDHLSVAYI